MQQLSLLHLAGLATCVADDALVTFKSDGYSPNGLAPILDGQCAYMADAGALTFGEFRQQINDDFRHALRAYNTEDPNNPGESILEAVLLARLPRDPARTIPIPLVGFEYRVDGSLPSLVLIEQGE